MCFSSCYNTIVYTLLADSLAQDYLEDSFSSTYEVDGPLFRASSREEVKRARSLLLTLADTTYTVHSLSDDGDGIKTRQSPLLCLTFSCGHSLDVQGAALKILYSALELLTALYIYFNRFPRRFSAGGHSLPNSRVYLGREQLSSLEHLCIQSTVLASCYPRQMLGMPYHEEAAPR